MGRTNIELDERLEEALREEEDLGAALLSPDSDFARIALHTPLSLA